MNNFVDIDKINSQIERANIQKSILIRNIYREYELYLNLLRDLLYSSIENGIVKLCSDPSIENIFINSNKLSYFIKEKISKLIHAKLPLFTVEQLKINKIEKKIHHKINSSGLVRISDSKENLSEKFQCVDGLQFVEPLNFDISDDISNNFEYYRSENNENLVSLNLDDDDSIKYSPNNQILENIGIEKQFITSFFELIKEVKVENSRNFENYNFSKMDISPNNQNLKDFDL